MYLFTFGRLDVGEMTTRSVERDGVRMTKVTTPEGSVKGDIDGIRTERTTCWKTSPGEIPSRADNLASFARLADLAPTAFRRFRLVSGWSGVRIPHGLRTLVTGDGTVVAVDTSGLTIARSTRSLDTE